MCRLDDSHENRHSSFLFWLHKYSQYSFLAKTLYRSPINLKFSWFIFTLDFVSHPFFLALFVKLMGKFFYSLLVFYCLHVLFPFTFYIWLLILYVPTVINFNFPLTISIHNQLKSLRESINWSPNGKCFDLFFFFLKFSWAAYFLREFMEVSQDNLCVFWLKGLNETAMHLNWLLKFKELRFLKSWRSVYSVSIFVGYFFLT